MKFLALCLAVALASLVIVACGGDSKGGIFSGVPTAERSDIVTMTPKSGTTPSTGTTPSRTPSTARTLTPDNANREDWQAAMLDDSKSLPGTYVSPHPGADGRACETKSCVNNMDDRNHVSGTIPICTAAQISSRSFSNPLCYGSNPPTSGPHASQFATNRVFDEPVAKESLVHAMEHAAVIIWYNTTDRTVIETLAKITNGANQSRKFVVMSKYDGMESNTIALTAWTRLDKFSVSDFKDQRVLDFINAHSRRFNPEGF